MGWWWDEWVGRVWMPWVFVGEGDRGGEGGMKVGRSLRGGGGGGKGNRK